MLNVLSAAVGLILAAFMLLQQIAFWQRKEYRLDRVRAEVMMQAQSPRRWLPLVLLLGVLVTSLIFRRQNQLALANVWGWVGLGLILVAYVYQTFRRGWFKPQPTAKALVISGLAVLLCILGLVLGFRQGLTDSASWLLYVMLTPLTTAIAVGVGNSIGEQQKKRVIAKARRQRRTLADLTVIGITGSYGKTSTKYFLHHLMSGDNADTVMSADRRNETFVIAQDVLSNLTPKTSTYIVEMAAYRRHEIERLAELVQPSIGVVTAISNQHVALFGSLEHLAAAKWELIDSLPASGVAVLNADDPTIKTKAASYTGRTVWYSLTKPADVWAEQIISEATASHMRLHIGDAAQTITIPLPGAGYVSAAVAAAAAAHAAHVPAATIFTRLGSVPAVPQTMTIITNSRGSVIIDDSYSANEAGVLMALKQLALFPQPKKIVVLRPLIELGSEAERAHTAIGQALAKTGATVFLYDTPGAADIERVATQAVLTGKIFRIAAPAALAEAVSAALDNNTVCLLENRLPEVVRQAALA